MPGIHLFSLFSCQLWGDASSNQKFQSTLSAAHGDRNFWNGSQLNNGNVNRSCISMRYFYVSVYPHFGMLLSSRPPDSLPLFRWIHINMSQNYFKFWMYWSWQIQAHTTCCNLDYKVEAYFLLRGVKRLKLSFLIVIPDLSRNDCLNQLLQAKGDCQLNGALWG